MRGDAILDALHAAGVKRAMRDEPMSRHTSWRIGGPADYCCVVEREDQLAHAIRVAHDHHLPWIVLGGGNNILVADAGIEGLVILNRLQGISIERDRELPCVRCGAGVFFARVAHFTAQRGFSGMEWGIAIPGTVGGGVVNNAGAHWSDVSRSLISAAVIDPAQLAPAPVPEELGPDALAYRYRGSTLKRPHATQTRLVVVSCRFRLSPDTPRDVLSRVEELRRHRLRTQPVKEASAGSTFTNPEEEFAGSLIDRAGLKGHCVGGAQIAPLHANFILNVADARATDVLALIRLAQERVFESNGIRLQTEVQFVGRWRQDELAGVAWRTA
jgi:UDP-N-acetylmuramate dehydrogenase